MFVIPPATFTDKVYTNHLLCYCVSVDASLPPVPSIKFTLSDDYPSSLPHVDLTMELYNSSNFFQEIKTKFLSNLKRLQDKYSMTALLETWVSEIYEVGAVMEKLRKACVLD